MSNEFLDFGGCFQKSNFIIDSCNIIVLVFFLPFMLFFDKGILFCVGV